MARRYKVSEATVSRAMAAYRAMADAPRVGLPCAENAGESQTIVGVLPLSALDERLAIVGTSGSGKTYAAKGLVERLMDQGARVCVVDPLGVWWGLRQGADGAASPSPHPVVVFGGQHADVALDEGPPLVAEPPVGRTASVASRSDRRRAAMGATLGHVVGTHAMACVVDVSDLGSAAARRGFMTAFMTALYGPVTS